MCTCMVCIYMCEYVRNCIFMVQNIQSGLVVLALTYIYIYIYIYIPERRSSSFTILYTQIHAYIYWYIKEWRSCSFTYYILIYMYIYIYIYRNGGAVGLWSEKSDQVGLFWHLHTSPDEIGDAQVCANTRCLYVYVHVCMYVCMYDRGTYIQGLMK